MTLQMTLKCTHLSNQVFFHFPTFVGLIVGVLKSPHTVAVTENGGGRGMHRQKVFRLYIISTTL